MLAPSLTNALFAACSGKDWRRAEDLRSAFLPLEDQRDAWGPARVLHAATELAGVAQTGAIRMRASFDNASGRFTPGLSARLRMESATANDAVLVPERAIGTDQTKKFVYVVEADGKPQFREVKLGALADGMRVVQGNLKGGEHVVVDGLQRIQPGMSVTPQLLQIDAKGLPIYPPQGGTGAPPSADKKSVAKS